MTKSRLSYFALWLLTGLWILLQETGALPQHFLPRSPMADYVANLLCFGTAVGGTYLAYRRTGLARAAFRAAAQVSSQPLPLPPLSWRRTKRRRSHQITALHPPYIMRCAHLSMKETLSSPVEGGWQRESVHTATQQTHDSG